MSINMRRIKRMTQPLTPEEYGSRYPFDPHTALRKHVNMEEKSWYEDKPIPLPKFEIARVESNNPGWTNFFIGVKMGLKQLKP